METSNSVDIVPIAHINGSIIFEQKGQRSRSWTDWNFELELPRYWKMLARLSGALGQTGITEGGPYIVTGNTVADLNVNWKEYVWRRVVVCKSVRGLAAVHSESSLQQARGLADPLWDDMSKRGVQLSLRNRATLLVIWKRIKSHRKSAVCCVTNVYMLPLWYSILNFPYISPS